MFSRFNSIDGFTLPQVLLCFSVSVMAFSIAEMIGRGFDYMPQIISNGVFDRMLVRPKSIIFQLITIKIDFARLGRMLQAIIIFCYAIPNSGVAWTWDKVFTLFLMVSCGGMVFFALFILYAAFSFFTIEGLEFMNVLTHGGQEFGRYPFSIYGKGILRFLTFVVPLALFQYYPLLYLLDMEQSKFYMFLPLFSLLFLIPAYTFFRIGLRRYKSTGS
jgi:ABC-2 type transport system permease protein